MSDQQEAKAVLDLLDADNVPPPLVVLDALVPTGQLPPYVLVYFGFSAPEAALDSQSSDLTNASRRRECMAYCHSVGGSAAAARAVASRVKAALLDKTPTITGRKCFPIRYLDGQPAGRNESTGPAVFDQVDVYRLSSVPA